MSNLLDFKYKRELTLRESQEAQLEILKFVISICKKLNLRYWVMYGTLLGAIRHQGFIPWDDDIDIAMPQDDYNNLIKYLTNNKDDIKPFEIHNRNTVKNCFFNITRICDSRYLLDFDCLSYTSGMFIDIYPFVGLSDSFSQPKWEQWNIRSEKIKKYINLSCSGNHLYGKNFLNKIFNIPMQIYSKIKGNQYFLSLLDIYPTSDFNESRMVGCPSWACQAVSNNFKDLIEVPFEDITVSVPKEYKVVLTELYGNYNRLPKEEDRKPHHSYKAYYLTDDKKMENIDETNNNLRNF